jgi:hypothetical protein
MEKTLADDFPPDDMELIKQLAQSKDKRINSHVLGEFLSAANEIGWSVIPSLPLELALIRTVGEKE